MKTKCLICNKKDSKSSVILTDWIIDLGSGLYPQEKARFGKKKEIHSDCLTNKLYIERSDNGFVYGRIPIFKPTKKRKKINAISNET